MIINDQRIYAIELEGVTAVQFLLSLAMAAYKSAPAIDADDPGTDELSFGDAADHVKGSHLLMLFAKERMPMTHIEVLGQTLCRDRLTLNVRVVMCDGDAVQLFQAAGEIMDQLFGDEVIDAEPYIEADISPEPYAEIEIDVELDESWFSLPPVAAAA